MAEKRELVPLLSDLRWTVADLEAAYARVEAGSLGRVVIQIN